MVRASPRGIARPALAFAISKKVGNAVVRNRVRRQLRHAAVQLEQDAVFEPAPYLVVVHPKAVECSMKELAFHLESATSKQPKLERTQETVTDIMFSDSPASHDRLER